METEEAVLALAALSQQTRLEAFRTLVRHEPDGVAAGDLARLLEVPSNTLSAHLSILLRTQTKGAEPCLMSSTFRGASRPKHSARASSSPPWSAPASWRKP